MTRLYLLIALIALVPAIMQAQTGCTDPKAQNYNSLASTNDGNCTYAATTLPLTNAKALPTTLNESSGIVFTSGGLWTHNDSGNPPAIYRISESTGAILQTVTITNATNVDWEDITADNNYIYVGDFGNNADGIRTNLRVYRVSKSDIGSASTVSVTAAIINFSYSDQVIGASPGSRNTEFDCEAFFVKNNVLHLFSKDWVHGHTKHYQLSTTPGTYSISSGEPFMDVNGLITSADISANNEIVLVGYDESLTNVFMYLIYDYQGSNFFSGNKRRLSLGSVIDIGSSANSRGQVEAVAFTANGNGYVTNERISSSPSNVPARLYSFSVTDLISLPVNLLSFTATYVDPEVQLKWQTASEINSAFFAVERSGDAVHFEELGRRQTARNSGSVTDYKFADRLPLAGNNFYRLRQVDADGAEKIYDIKKVTVNKADAQVRAYVSSSQGNTLVINVGRMQTAHLFYRIIDLNGTVLKSAPLHASTEQVNISFLAKGQYIFALSNGQSAWFQKK